MTTYARIRDGVVADLFTPPEGIALATCFHPDVADSFVPVPDGASPQSGWTYAAGEFIAPVEDVPVSAMIAFNALLNRFTVEEMTALMTLARSNDDVFKWLIMGAAANSVDLADPEVNTNMEKLVDEEVITSERCDTILTP